MIYITGDTHGDFKVLEYETFKNLNKNDYVIICGDFGLVWNYEKESLYEKVILNHLEKYPFTILFVDGNHENFDRLYNYPVKQWKGGKVHQIGKNVYHLMRGEVFTIDGKKFFAFGGASSHDIQDGILEEDDYDKIYEYRSKRKVFRIRNWSWWDLELPTPEEMQNAKDNLEKHNYKVDYVISHCLPSSIQDLFKMNFESDRLTDFFDEIKSKLDFKMWYCGHYHINDVLMNKYSVLYYVVIPLYEGDYNDEKE